jgi:type IV secretory pathway TrbD component
MNAFLILEYLAWVLSFGLGLWLLVDLVRTNMAFSEAVLMSSREGEIEDELIIDPTHRGPH